jgi:hypothetical protein
MPRKSTRSVPLYDTTTSKSALMSYRRSVAWNDCATAGQPFAIDFR